MTMSPPGMTLVTDSSSSDFDFAELDLQFGGLDNNAALPSPDYYSLMMPPFSASLACPSPEQHLQGSSAQNASHTMERSISASRSDFFPDTSKQLLNSLDNAQLSNQASSPHHEAVTIALQLMGQLCSLDSSCRGSVGLTPLDAGVCKATLTEANKMTAETVTKILDCGGSEDGHCLVIVCLAFSKLLDGYSKAAEALNIRDDNQAGPGSVSISSASRYYSAGSTSMDSDTTSCDVRPATRATDAKAVPELLDDLYRLRSLLDRLGNNIRACLNRNWDSDSDSSASVAGSANVQSHSPPTFPFSATIMNQLYDELRRRLSAISLGILAKSKQFWVQ